MSDINFEIEKVINKIRPYIQRDGGDIRFVSFKDGIVFVEMLGACRHCLMQDDTISESVEALLIEEVSGVKKVEVIES